MIYRVNEIRGFDEHKAEEIAAICKARPEKISDNTKKLEKKIFMYKTLEIISLGGFTLSLLAFLWYAMTMGIAANTSTRIFLLFISSIISIASLVGFSK